MIAVVTVRADKADRLEVAALSKAATLWNCHLDCHTWYLDGSYTWKIAILTAEPVARPVDSTEPGDQLHRSRGQWEATFEVGPVRA